MLVFFYVSNKVVVMRLCQRAWGRVSHAAHYAATWSLKFKICSVWDLSYSCLWVCPVSHHTSPALEASNDMYHLMM